MTDVRQRDLFMHASSRCRILHARFVHLWRPTMRLASASRRPSEARSAAERRVQNTTGHGASRALSVERLFSQSELADDLLISRAIFARQILQQAVSPADHLQQPATRGVILLVRLEVLGQLGDPLGQQRDLHFRRTGVFLVNLVVGNDLSSSPLRDRHRSTPRHQAASTRRAGMPVIKSTIRAAPCGEPLRTG